MKLQTGQKKYSSFEAFMQFKNQKKVGVITQLKKVEEGALLDKFFAVLIRDLTLQSLKLLGSKLRILV